METGYVGNWKKFVRQLIMFAIWTCIGGLNILQDILIIEISFFNCFGFLLTQSK